jgi:hypothetical protein
VITNKIKHKLEDKDHLVLHFCLLVMINQMDFNYLVQILLVIMQDGKQLQLVKTILQQIAILNKIIKTI